MPVLFCHFDQLLPTCRSDRDDHPAALFELLQEFLGKLRSRRRDDDAVIWGIFWPALPAIAQPIVDVVDIQLAQPLLCFFQQFWYALHRIDLLDKRRQHGRLVATAGAYLEYAVALESLQQRLGHLGNDIRLTDRLSQSER